MSTRRNNANFDIDAQMTCSAGGEAAARKTKSKKYERQKKQDCVFTYYPIRTYLKVVSIVTTLSGYKQAYLQLAPI